MATRDRRVTGRRRVASRLSRRTIRESSSSDGVSDAQKRSWLRRVHALVAPSTHGESFGLVLLEGMASETLVVASDIDGYREAAGGHATLFHPGDARSLERPSESALRDETSRASPVGASYAEDWSMTKLMDEYETRYELARQRFADHPVA